MSALALGAIAGIVVAVILTVASILALLVYKRIIRDKKTLNNKVQPMRFPKITMAPGVGDHSQNSELCGKRVEQEMPAQEMRHEMF